MKKIMNKNTIGTIKFVGVIVVIILVLKVVFTFVPPLNKYDFFAIKTDSMDPIIEPGDLVVIKEIDSEDIEVGDIMAFYVDITHDGNDEVVVHYIDEISLIDGKLIYKTKSHISEIQDNWVIEEQDLIGIYSFQVNYLGKALLFAQSWIGKVIIIVDLIIVSVIYDMFFTKRKGNEEINKS